MRAMLATIFEVIAAISTAKSSRQDCITSRRRSDGLTDDAVLRLALERSFERQQVELSHETFEYLRWKIEVAREDAARGPRRHRT